MSSSSESVALHRCRDGVRVWWDHGFAQRNEIDDQGKAKRGVVSMNARSLMLHAVAACAALAVLMPASAGAYATVAAPPSGSGISGLPDGRIYEEVSPPNKHGNQVAGRSDPAFATPDGQAILYFGTGAGEDQSSGSNQAQVARRMPQGWVSRSATPLGAPGDTGNVLGGGEEENASLVANQITWFDPARGDLEHFAFTTWGHGAFAGPPDEKGLSNNFFLAGPDPLTEPAWFAQPQNEEGLEGAVRGSSIFNELFLAGGSPNLETLYFYYEGGLLPRPQGEGQSVVSEGEVVPPAQWEGDSWLYEYRDGVLRDAGELPGGEHGTSAAAPAAQPIVARGELRGKIPAAGFDNEVSADGSRLFFTRRDDAGTLELYVRIVAAGGSHRTLLVSRSELAGHVGDAAPDGLLAMASTEAEEPYAGLEGTPGQPSAPSYAFASPDGSRVFFQSEDQLTEAAPNDASAKTYVFDVDTEALEYLPGIAGSIVSVAADGSSLTFENTSTTPFELDRWSAGASGGAVVPIVQLPEPSTSLCGTVVCVGPAYTSTGGGVLTFSTESQIAGFNDGGSHYQLSFLERPETSRLQLPNKQIFRYDAAANTLECLSCPKPGVTPSANAIISNADQEANGAFATGGHWTPQNARGVSADGSRVFFETPEALVGQDVNGQMDVYEWENGTLFLVSSGRSPEPSFVLDNSESGGDVFFTTTEGIAEGDTDGARDVYDARIPRPGDTPPPAALPCEGDTCQGAPSVPNLLAPPASATFQGVGNLAQSAVTRTAHAQRGSRHRKKAHKRRLHSRRHHKEKGHTSRRQEASGAVTVAKHATRRGK